jgi:hypothetical protein
MPLVKTLRALDTLCNYIAGQDRQLRSCNLVHGIQAQKAEEMNFLNAHFPEFNNDLNQGNYHKWSGDVLSASKLIESSVIDIEPNTPEEIFRLIRLRLHTFSKACFWKTFGVHSPAILAFEQSGGDLEATALSVFNNLLEIGKDQNQPVALLASGKINKAVSTAVEIRNFERQKTEVFEVDRGDGEEQLGVANGSKKRVLDVKGEILAQEMKSDEKKEATKKMRITARAAEPTIQTVSADDEMRDLIHSMTAQKSAELVRKHTEEQRVDCVDLWALLHNHAYILEGQLVEEVETLLEAAGCVTARDLMWLTDDEVAAIGSLLKPVGLRQLFSVLEKKH